MSRPERSPEWATTRAGGAARSAARLASVLPMLHRRALLLTRDPDLAADLVQDTCEQALLHRPPADCPFDTWLVGLLVETALAAAATRRRERAERDGLWVLTPRTGVDGTVRAERRLQARQIARAIEIMPDPLRAAVVLVGLDARRCNETARLLGIPSGTLFSRLSRARDRLADQIGWQRDVVRRTVPRRRVLAAPCDP